MEENRKGVWIKILIKLERKFLVKSNFCREWEHQNQVKMNSALHSHSPHHHHFGSSSSWQNDCTVTFCTVLKRPNLRATLVVEAALIKSMTKINGSVEGKCSTHVKIHYPNKICINRQGNSKTHQLHPKTQLTYELSHHNWATIMVVCANKLSLCP